MNLLILDMPDDPVEVGQWLEQHLIAMDLSALVAELSAVHGTPSDEAVDLTAMLGDALPLIREEGLIRLPPDTLPILLRHPRLLFALQEDVFINGGYYWQQLVAEAGRRSEAVQRGKARLLAALGAGEAPVLAAESSRPRQRWYRAPWCVSLATAATVLLAVFGADLLGWWGRPAVAAAPGWGWNAPGALDPAKSPAEYLARLANSANQWFNKRPTDAAALAQRLLQMRGGCSALLLANHSNLDERDRDWLLQQCRAAAAQFDQQLTALESDKKPNPLTIRDQADATVTTLIEALKKRAEEIKARA